MSTRPANLFGKGESIKGAIVARSIGVVLCPIMGSNGDSSVVLAAAGSYND